MQRSETFSTMRAKYLKTFSSSTEYLLQILLLARSKCAFETYFWLQPTVLLVLLPCFENFVLIIQT